MGCTSNVSPTPSAPKKEGGDEFTTWHKALPLRRRKSNTKTRRYSKARRTEKPRYLTSGEKAGQKGPTPEILFSTAKWGGGLTKKGPRHSFLFQRSYKTRPCPAWSIYLWSVFDWKFHKNSPSKLINKKTHKAVYDKQICDSQLHRALSVPYRI
ncbi:hypothetical protein JTE90_011790 [Oedothorax gibbosus]|uniref:Uncharacterized protein n=1 Tax=Oedothorax gibbosus TaxID=931172 RepID=A0AAV6VRR0_9ARAC|nr:hypothetical protein JTE90_011790 [Oedothorax gibbosus]